LPRLSVYVYRPSVDGSQGEGDLASLERGDEGSAFGLEGGQCGLDVGCNPATVFWRFVLGEFQKGEITLK
jgi:hypothetical protein